MHLNAPRKPVQCNRPQYGTTIPAGVTVRMWSDFAFLKWPVCSGFVPRRFGTPNGLSLPPLDDHTRPTRHAKCIHTVYDSWMAEGAYRILAIVYIQYTTETPHDPWLSDPPPKNCRALEIKNLGLSNIFKNFRDYHHNEYFSSSSHIFPVASVKTLGVI